MRMFLLSEIYRDSISFSFMHNYEYLPVQAVHMVNITYLLNGFSLEDTLDKLSHYAR